MNSSLTTLVGGFEVPIYQDVWARYDFGQKGIHFLRLIRPAGLSGIFGLRRNGEEDFFDAKYDAGARQIIRVDTGEPISWATVVTDAEKEAEMHK